VNAGGFRLDPEAVRGGGNGIQDSAEALRARLAAFQGELEGYGQPWGADDIGTLIGLCYQAISTVAMECYQANIEEIAGYGEGVGLMADSFEKVEQDIEQGLARFRESLG